MEYSDDAVLQVLPIGPSSVLGRVLALKLLFCGWLREGRVVLWTKVLRVFAVWKRSLFGFWLRRLFAWLNPRNPSVLLIAAVLASMLLGRAKMQSQKMERAYRRKFWSNLMKTALTYEEWAHAARMLDKDKGRRKDSDLYDEDLVRAKLNELRLRRLEGGVKDILFCIRADLVRNLGNMCNPELHKGRLQTPRLIQEYINEVRYQLRAVCETDSESCTAEEKIAFIHETRHGFGRTALLLSGGAALGSFHLGVVRTLIEHRLLPRVVAGASVGSIICSFAATRTWSELQSFFDDPMPPMHFFESMGSIFATAHRLLTRGAVHEIGALQRKMRQLIGDLTFQEAYDLSGRVLGIAVCSPRKLEPPRCLNYLTSPHVVIWSAVTASCAFPGLFEAQELMAKDRSGHLVPYHTPAQVGPEEKGIGKRQWRDGTLESDLPMMQLKELFNVNHFIVSQANPHIAPLLRLKEIVRAYGGDFAGKLAHLLEMEVKHRCKQVLEMGFSVFGLAKLFAQDWEGDVTIVMPATFAQFAKIITNPTPTDLRKAVMQGRRCTWAKLSAIQANCGIELMLDECVSELNRRRKIRRQAEHNSTAQAHGGMRRSSAATKRIPSWNNMARENSWGSMDDEGMDTALQLGGPWGGPSLRKLRPVRISHDGSDSDDSMDFSQLSWTRVGGPLMRTASAAKFIMCYNGEVDAGTGDTQIELRGQESGEEIDGIKLSTKFPGGGNGELRSGKRANKIWDKIVSGSDVQVHGGCEGKNDEFGSSALDGRGFSFPLQKSVSLDRMTKNEGQAQEKQKHGFRCGSNAACECSGLERTASCDCSNPDKRFDCEQPCTIPDLLSQSLNSAKVTGSKEDLEQIAVPSAVDDEGAAEISMGQALKSTSRQAQSEGLQGRALERGAFGSFLRK